MKVIFILFVFVVFLYSKTYDLVEVYKLANLSNEDYKIAQFETTLKEKEIDKSLSSFYPQVRIDGKYIRKNEFPVIVDGVEEERRRYRKDIVLNIDQILYDRSKYLNYKLISNDYSQSILTQAQEKQKLMFEVIKYYFETLFKAKQINLANQKLKRLEKILQRAEEKYKSGFISKADYLEAKVQKDELLTQKLSLELDFSLSKSFLEKLTGIKDIKIKKNIDLKKISFLNLRTQEEKIQHNLDIKIQKLKVLQSKTKKELSFSKFEPTLSVNYEYEINNIPGIDNERNLIFLLRINLFNGFYDVKSYEQSKISTMIETLVFNKLVKETKQNLTNKTNKIISYLKIIKSYPEILKSKKFSLEGMRERFNLGTKSIIDLLDEENKYYEKLNKFTEFKYLFVLEYAGLKQYTNSLNNEFLDKVNGFLYE